MTIVVRDSPIWIDEDLEFQFRQIALKRLKKDRGIISLAAEEAIGDWVQKQQQRQAEAKD